MIRRRVKVSKKRIIRKRPKLSEWKLLYNRLYDEDSDFGVYEEVANHMPHRTLDGDVFNLFTDIISRFSAKVETLQINYPKDVTFRVSLKWEDRDAMPRHGFIYPKLFVIKTSTDLWRTATLAYLELCDKAGKWL